MNFCDKCSTEIKYTRNAIISLDGQETQIMLGTPQHIGNGDNLCEDCLRQCTMQRSFSEVIMPNLPNMGMISVLSKRHEEVLTDEFLQRWLYQLYNDHLIDPDYVFMTQEDRANLWESLIAYPGLLARAYREMSSPDTLDTYVNRTTSRLMSVVVLPGLPENMLLVGNLALHVKDEKNEG